jgi:L-ribulose-5-phosphate 3-epimerase
MPRIAIMQGRLVPPEAGRFQCFPRDHWRKEFPLAAQAGLEAIEWIYDQFGDDVNPLGSDDGIHEMQSLGQQHGIDVCSVCADYFMDRPLLRVSQQELAESVQRLRWLIDRCRRAGIRRVVLPFVDQSRIEDDEDAGCVVDVLTSVLAETERSCVELHLETALAPASFAALLDRLPHPNLKVNYDSGNSSSLGYRCDEEFAAYGHRIGSVHVKDRLLGGGTVPLGQGNADLRAVFDGLDRIGYRGDYVLQVARDEPDHEVSWAKHNRAIVIEHLLRRDRVLEGGRK